MVSMNHHHIKSFSPLIILHHISPRGAILCLSLTTYSRSLPICQPRPSSARVPGLAQVRGLVPFSTSIQHPQTQGWTETACFSKALQVSPSQNPPAEPLPSHLRSRNTEADGRAWNNVAVSVWLSRTYSLMRIYIPTILRYWYWWESLG